MFTIRPSRQEMYSQDPKFLWKYILRSLAIVLAIISIGLIGWSITHQVFVDNIYDIDDYGYYHWFYTDIWFLPWEFITLGLSIIWNFINILVLLIRNRPIHPGANVACDLLLWLGLIATGTLATAGAERYFWFYPDDYDILYEDSLTQTYANGSTYSILPDGAVGNPTSTFSPTSTLCEGFTSCATRPSHINRKGVIILVGAVISFIVLLMHFALFISACRYTNARRVNAKVAVMAERIASEKVMSSRRDAGREGNPNAAFVPINEPVEQQAPLGYGMPPAPTGMTLGESRMKRAVVSQQQEQGQEQGRKGTRYSYEQPEVVVHGNGGEHAVTTYTHGDGVYEA